MSPATPTRRITPRTRRNNVIFDDWRYRDYVIGSFNQDKRTISF